MAFILMIFPCLRVICNYLKLCVFTNISVFCCEIFLYSRNLLFSFLGYISTAINDGPGCLMLRCPDPSCAATIGQDMINALTSDEDREKYIRYFIRSYVEDNRKVIILKTFWVIGQLCMSNIWCVHLFFLHLLNLQKDFSELHPFIYIYIIFFLMYLFWVEGWGCHCKGSGVVRLWIVLFGALWFVFNWGWIENWI